MKNTVIAIASVLAGLALVLAAPSTAGAQVECDKPNIMLVLDSSSSMDTTDSGQTKSRWQIARDAVTSILNSFGTQARWGLMLYPTNGDCAAGACSGTTYYVALGDSTAATIISKVNRSTSYGGNTPGYGTMINAGKAACGLHDSSRLNFVIYVTDGEPNCDADCQYYDPDCTINATASLFAMGIKTFIIGMGSSAYASTLNAMAEAGGTSRPGTTKYYPATSPAQLTSALTTIVNLATTRPCKNPCGTGVEACVNKKWANCTAPTDCCTSTYNYCDTGKLGICADGQMICVNAVLTCVQYNQKTVETCNGLDDDCNGKVDDGIAPRDCTNSCGNKGKEYCEMGTWGGCDAEPCCGGGGSCDTGLPGICAEGTMECINDVPTCVQKNQPLDQELCNGLDDNCNGETDEGNPGGGDLCMTGMKGECAFGHTFCQGGSIVCVPDKTPNPEYCNGLDDDCDGIIDNGVANRCGTCGDIPPDACTKTGNVCDGFTICKPDQDCINGQCVGRCINNECSGGLKCRDDHCVDPCNGVTCDKNWVCIQGDCYDMCKNVSCVAGYICVMGKCVPDNCYETGCEKGKLCMENKCSDDPCNGVSCDPTAGDKGEFCRGGQCVDSCGRVVCESGKKCVDGNCVADPCYGKKCDPGQMCDQTGNCVADPCSGVECGKGRVCKNGSCSDDPCNGVKCPRAVEYCKSGQCVVPGTDTDGGTDGAADGAMDGAADGAHDAAVKDAGPDGGQEADGSAVKDGSHGGDTGAESAGCACSSAGIADGAAGAGTLLASLAALVFALSRGRKR